MMYLTDNLFLKWKESFSFPKFNKLDIVFLILFSSIVFVGLGKSSLQDWDEGIYAEVSREMVENNNWLIPTHGNNPWFEKPPLYMWLTAAVFKVFGINEFGARAVSASSGVFVIVLTYLIGSIVYGRRVGFLSVLPLLASFEFLHQARNGTTDIMLTMFMLISIISYIRTSKSNNYWYLFWVSFGLGFMVKFWASCIILIALCISTVLGKKVKETIVCRQFWFGYLIALVIILPWHLFMIIHYGPLFIDRYFLYDLIRRSVVPLEKNYGSKRFYFDGLLLRFTPWFLLLPTALTREFVRIQNKLDRTNLLLVFAICIFGTYSIIVNTKIFQYLTPIFPILSIFIAKVVVEAYEDKQSIAHYGLLFAFLLSSVMTEKAYIPFMLIIVSLTIFNSLGNNLNYRLHGFIKWEKHSAFVSRYIPNLYSIFCAALDKRNLHKLSVILVVFFLTLIGIIKIRPLYATVVSPVEQISRIAGSSVDLYDKPIIGIALPDAELGDCTVGPAAMFYSNRQLEIAWTKEQLEKLTSQGPREIIIGETLIPRLSDTYDFTVLEKYSPFVYGTIVQDKIKK